eukprot:7057055-Lingulodinium_polyedra.AAC.1
MGLGARLEVHVRRIGGADGQACLGVLDEVAMQAILARRGLELAYRLPPELSEEALADVLGKDEAAAVEDNGFRLFHSRVL